MGDDNHQEYSSSCPKILSTVHVASFQGHSQILSHSRGKNSTANKIWEWPGNEATVHIRVREEG